MIENIEEWVWNRKDIRNRFKSLVIAVPKGAGRLGRSERTFEKVMAEKF